MKQSPLRVGVDIDSVIADILTPWLDLYNAEYNDNLTVAQITGWDMHKFVKPECGLAIYKYLENQDFYDKVPVIEGALEGIKALEERGYQIFYISSCVPETMDQKMRWMQKHVPGFNWKQVVFTHEKYLIDIDVLIDDGPHNLEQMPGWVATIRYKYPYNEGVAASAHIHNWDNIVEKVEGAAMRIKRYKQTELVVFNQ